MTQSDVDRLLDAYIAAWKSYDRDAIADLFAQHVDYRYHPYDEPIRGREAVVASWLGESDGPGASTRDEPGTYDASYRAVAVDGDTAVAVGTSTYSDVPGGLPTRVRQLLRDPLRRRGPLSRVHRVVHAASARVTRRRSGYRSLDSLQRDNRVCRACVEAGYPLESLPVLEGHAGQRAYIYGQAPGVVEGDERRPWRGRAGQTLRRWLDLDEDEFYATFYCASVTRCYPGRSPSGPGDRVPTPREQELCSFWFEWELRLLRPKLIVAVGGLAIRRLVGRLALDECIGCEFERNGATVVPLPHPSGVSRWTNAPANRRLLEDALALIRARL